jgi:hypothetical protein
MLVEKLPVHADAGMRDGRAVGSGRPAAGGAETRELHVQLPACRGKIDVGYELRLETGRSRDELVRPFRNIERGRLSELHDRFAQRQIPRAAARHDTHVGVRHRLRGFVEHAHLQFGGGCCTGQQDQQCSYTCRQR